MKTMVFVAGNTGIDDVPHLPGVSVLPERIIFSDEEVYDSHESMDSLSFAVRMKNDPLARPEITGCTEQKFKELLKNAMDQSYDSFMFILTREREEHYTPMIEEFKENNPKIQVSCHVMKSSLYPAAFAATEAEARFRAGDDFDDVNRSLDFFDEFNAVYLFSAAADSDPEVSHTPLQDTAFTARPKTVFYYIQSDSPEQRRIKTGSSIKSYVEDYCHEIEEKNIIPFLVYSNPRSQLVRALSDILTRLFPQMKKVRMFPMSAEAMQRYGVNSCGIGYLLNRDIAE